MQQHPLTRTPPLLEILKIPLALLCVGPIQGAVKVPALVKCAGIGARHVDADDPVVCDYGDVRFAHERGSKHVYEVICGTCGQGPGFAGGFILDEASKDAIGREGSGRCIYVGEWLIDVPSTGRGSSPDAPVSLAYSASTYEHLFARIGKGRNLRRPRPLRAARRKQNATHQSVKLTIHVQIGKVSFVPSLDDVFFLPSHILDSLL